MNITIAALYIYPIKSLGHISIKTARAEYRGLKYDRRWMVVDDEGRFMTQREYPSMAMIDVKMTCDELQLSYTKGTFGTVSIPLNGPEKGHRINVKVWDDQVWALSPGLTADGWLQEVLKQKCRLVYMPDDVSRPADKRYAPVKTNVSFADAFPFLLANKASLQELSKRIGADMSMLRFRPNIVVDDNTPYTEDHWKKIGIGPIVFHVVKPCARCVVTTIEPGTDNKGAEPLRTLSGYRKKNNKIYFGQNMIVEREGVISVGDRVQVFD